MLRVAEVLNFILSELSHAYQAGSGRDLIPVGLANLCCCKGQFATIVVQQSGNVPVACTYNSLAAGLPSNDTSCAGKDRRTLSRWNRRLPAGY